jgi:hypothetical protein
MKEGGVMSEKQDGTETAPAGGSSSAQGSCKSDEGSVAQAVDSLSVMHLDASVPAPPVETAAVGKEISAAVMTPPVPPS